MISTFLCFVKGFLPRNFGICSDGALRLFSFPFLSCIANGLMELKQGNNWVPAIFSYSVPRLSKRELKGTAYHEYYDFTEYSNTIGSIIEVVLSSFFTASLLTTLILLFLLCLLIVPFRTKVVFSSVICFFLIS